MKRTFFKQVLALIAGGILTAGTAQATSISFTATDVADTVVGQDTWQYEYTVTDNTFNADEGFTIWFDYGLYDNITPEINSADWDVISWNPDLIFGTSDDGAYDALALADGASLADTFTVSCTWLGGSDGPGTQYFDIYDSSYNVIESGMTAQNAPVPEPSTMLLMSTGLLGLIGTYRKKKNNA